MNKSYFTETEIIYDLTQFNTNTSSLKLADHPLSKKSNDFFDGLFK